MNAQKGLAQVEKVKFNQSAAQNLKNIKFSKKLFFGLITTILLAGIFWRFYYINFGLPHSLYADEPEIAEFAINYTYQFRDIVSNNNYYKLIPVSFVYGTFPTYLYTIITMGYSKLNGILGVTFDKQDIYVFLRSINSLSGLLIIPAAALLYKKMFKDIFGTLLTVFFIALNWKLIVHAHYLNTDLMITILLALSYFTIYKYYAAKNELTRIKLRIRKKTYYQMSSATLWTTATAVLLGLAIGTKITAALTLPLFVYIFVYKRDFRGIFAFLFIIYGIFIATNPFSLIFADRFALRIYNMKIKEGGLVFDSVDSNPFKYFYALGFITTPLIAIFGFVGMLRAAVIKHKPPEPKKQIIKKLKRIKNNLTKLIKNKLTGTLCNQEKQINLQPIHIFLILHVVFYIAFYTLGARRVDRWLLPIIPIISIYAAYTISKLRYHFNLITYVLILGIVLTTYMAPNFLLLTQFARNTPKSAAYLWARDNLDTTKFTFVVTEEGLDPTNKLPFSSVYQYQVYANEGAQFYRPPDPLLYDYIILSSRPMQNFKRPEVRQAYPLYVESWDDFEATVLDETKFKLIKSFELTKPNLIPLSDVFIYERLEQL